MGFNSGFKGLKVQALILCIGRTVHRGSRGIALPFLDHGTRRKWGVSFTPRPLFTSGKDPVPIVQEAGWASGPVWTGAENLAPTGIRSPAVQPVTSRYTTYANRPTFEILFFLWRCAPTRAMASSFLRFLDHTQQRTTVGRDPLDEWSARRRDLYLTTQTTDKHPYSQWV